MCGPTHDNVALIFQSGGTVDFQAFYGGDLLDEKPSGFCASGEAIRLCMSVFGMQFSDRGWDKGVLGIRGRGWRLRIRRRIRGGGDGAVSGKAAEEAHD